MTLPVQLKEYLKTRLSNHSFSMTHNNTYELKWTHGTACITGDKKIYVPEPSALTKESVEDMFCSEIHESGHLKYGSVEWDKLQKAIDDHELNPTLARNLWNCIEDYRVNTLVGYSHPGAGRLLRKVHSRWTKKEMRKIKDPGDAIQHELEYFPYTKEFGADGEEKLAKAVPLVRGIVGCLNANDSLEVLPKIYEIFYGDKTEEEIKKLTTPEKERKANNFDSELIERNESSLPDKDVEKNIEKAMERAPSTPPEETGTPEKGDGEETTEGESERVDGVKDDVTDGKGEGDPETEGSDSNPDGEREDGIGERKTSIPSGERHIGEDTLSDEDMDLDKTFEEAKKMMEEHERRASTKRKEFRKIAKECEGTNNIYEIGHKSITPTYTSKVNDNKAGISHLIRETKKVFLFRRSWEKGHKTGRLNTKKAYRVATGDAKVFMKKNEDIKFGEIAVSILVDESGSMGGDREEHAMEACIVLHEVFRKCGIKHMIAGYTADTKRRSDNTVHRVYKHWDDPYTAGNLVDIHAIANNRDGHSIRIATEFFKMARERKKLMIIISDGAPAAYNYRNGLEDTISAQREAERKGIKLINVGIGYGWELPEVYHNKLKIDNVSELTKKLMTVIRKEILR